MNAVRKLPSLQPGCSSWLTEGQKAHCSNCLSNECILPSIIAGVDPDSLRPVDGNGMVSSLLIWEDEVKLWQTQLQVGQLMLQVCRIMSCEPSLQIHGGCSA